MNTKLSCLVLCDAAGLAESVRLFTISPARGIILLI